MVFDAASRSVRQSCGETEKHADDNLGGSSRDVCIKPIGRPQKQRVRLVREEGPHNWAQELFDNACHAAWSHQAGKEFNCRRLGWELR